MKKIIALVMIISFCLQQAGFCQMAGQVDLIGAVGLASAAKDKFRPAHLRYLSYNALDNSLRLLVDKGDKGNNPENSASQLLKYFLVGVALPDDAFWVNLRPDSSSAIIDDYVARTDVGKIMLESDLQLKKDVAAYTSPKTKEGREYWEKLYARAGELFGAETKSIPTMTRPWIVPDEIIVRENNGSAYIYKATMKVMLEQDYLKDSVTFSFDDERLRRLNEYASEMIRRTIIPRLTREINSAKRYAGLRQVFYSLILAHWFKKSYAGQPGEYSQLINSKKLAGLESQARWDKNSYYTAYRTSFSEGEYNIKEHKLVSGRQVVRSYCSGGIVANPTAAVAENLVHLDNAANDFNEISNLLPDLVPLEAVNGAAPKIVSANRQADGGLTWELRDSDESVLEWVGETQPPKLEVKQLSEDDLLWRETSNNEWVNHTMLKAYSFSYLPAVGEDAAPDVIFYLIEGKGNQKGQFSIVRAEGRDISQVFLGADSPRALGAALSLSETNISGTNQLMLRKLNTRLMERIDQEAKKARAAGITLERQLRERKPAKFEVETLPAADVLRREALNKEWSTYIPLREFSLTYLETVGEDLAPDVMFYLVEKNGEFSIVRVEDRDVFQVSLGADQKRALGAIRSFSRTNISQTNQLLLGKLNTQLMARFDQAAEQALAAGVTFEREMRRGGAAISGPQADGGNAVADPPAGTKETAAISAEEKEKKQDLGGIDFRRLPITFQQATALLNEISVMPTAGIVNLGSEMLRMRKMIHSNMSPSTQRIKELIAACYQRGELDRHGHALLGCLAEILRQQEDSCQATGEDLRSLLVLLEIKR